MFSLEQNSYVLLSIVQTNENLYSVHQVSKCRDSTDSGYIYQAFLFDLFSASRPSGFAETLSFLLELLSFFPLSFEGMFENFKNSIFLL